MMPEQDYDPDSLRLGRAVADALRIDSVVEDITPILAGAGCYQRRDEHIRKVFPEYGPGWRCKIAVRKTGRLQRDLPDRAGARRQAAGGAHAGWMSISAWWRRRT